MLGQPPTCQRQSLLADQADRARRRGLDHPSVATAKDSPFGVQVVAEQRVEEVVDTVKGKRLTHKGKRLTLVAMAWARQRWMTWHGNVASTGRGYEYHPADNVVRNRTRDSQFFRGPPGNSITFRSDIMDPE